MFDITRSLHVLKSHLLALGLFEGNVIIGEPKSAPISRLSACIWMKKMHVATTNLQGAREIHMLTVRIYEDMLDDMGSQETVEEDMAKAAAQVMTMLYTDFNLDESVTDIDIGGWYDSPLEATWGYVQIRRAKQNF